MKFISKYSVITIDGRGEEQIIGKFMGLLEAEKFCEFWAGAPQQNVNASLRDLGVVEGLVERVAVRSSRSKSKANITEWKLPSIGAAAA